MHHEFIIVVDAHSEFPFVVPVPDQSSKTTVEALWAIMSSFGLPEQIVSDNGGAYISEEFERFCKVQGIKHIRSSAYHAATNGKAERFVRTFKAALKAMDGEAGTL